MKRFTLVVAGVVGIGVLLGAPGAAGTEPLAVEQGDSSIRLERGRTYFDNNLVTEAKSELVSVVVDSESDAEEVAEALVLLGKIGVREENPEGAKANWERVVEDFPSTSHVAEAQSLLEELRAGDGPIFEPETTLVVCTGEFAWASKSIAASLKQPAVGLDMELAEALELANGNDNVRGVVGVVVDVYSFAEDVRATCYRADGKKLWDKAARANWGGNEQKLAQKMVDRVARKVAGRSCP